MFELRIPGYELVAKLHEGGTATSWQAVSTTLNRAVILKILDPSDFDDDPEDLARIIGCMRKTAALRHQGLVPVIDLGEYKGLFYFVTEGLHGTPLSEQLLHQPLPSEQIMDMAQSVARALEYAWREAALFHGNLKPRNIITETNSSVMVSDLGLTRKGDITDPTTGEVRKTMLGTPNYMSPEQVAGRVELDCRTDIYSLGATMYHAATGRMPFHDTPGEQATIRHLRDFIPHPCDVNSNVSTGLGHMISEMMVRDRDERYADWGKVLRDLDRIKRMRVFVKKGTRLARSTVALPRVPAKKSSSLAASRKNENSGLYRLFRIVKWAAILAVWFYVGRMLFRLPPA